MSRAALACALLALSGCADEDLARGRRYVDERAFRRAALEGSLVDPDNGYATLRLDRYATEASGEPTGWDARPVWNPPVRPLTADDVGAFVEHPERPSTEAEGSLAPVFDAAELAWTEEALRALGRRAFETFPVQLSASVGAATDAEGSLARYGLWVDDRERVGGLVRVRLGDGSERFAVTCATCHARPDADGALVHGATNHRFDWGAVAHRDALRRGRPAEDVAHLLAWGPGQVDVTPDDRDNPTAITDLRAVRHQPLLHWAGTLENDLVALAIRLETLIVTSMGESVRPPREVAFALALYLWRMGEAGAAGDAAGEPEGAALFDRHCASCHGADGSVARARVPLAQVGTEPSVGESATRGTGHYRVPSLWGVAGRTQLLHDGRVDSLEALLDPARLDTVPGHAWGTSLDADERAALIRFARTIGAP
ncbi:MAG TPA: c-type cytochrome [Sandaracinaceae bacterium LLY-WYZ-13_1]|nr:c-type cytochrome [Sandaracinaceae bacterium LLY-WYZ-13_1]